MCGVAWRCCCGGAARSRARRGGWRYVYSVALLWREMEIWLVTLERRPACTLMVSQSNLIQEAGGIGVILVDLEGLDLKRIVHGPPPEGHGDRGSSSSSGGSSSKTCGGGKAKKEQQPEKEEPQKNPVYTSWQVCFCVVVRVVCVRACIRGAVVHMASAAVHAHSLTPPNCR